MKKLMQILFIVVYHVPTFSQTGPAGVGNSLNNVFWIKADAGTSSAITGTPINSWNDQSGNVINMTQTVAVQQPSFATNVFNGFPAILFDNVTSTNDKMLAPDSPVLDNTSGYTFFTVSRPVSYATTGSDRARVILSKRNNVDAEESFMLFHYTADNFFVDLQTTNNRFNTAPVTYPLGTNCLIDVVYDGTLASATRGKIYSAGSLIKVATEANALIPDNNSPLIIGSTDYSDPRPFGGYIGEVIVYREALNKASRIIVDNYLSAKYNMPLAVNDKYEGDDPLNGNYDFEVAGIGRDTIMPGSIVGSNMSFAPSASAGLGITNVSGLDPGDYILAGHASQTNMQVTYDVGGITGPNPARWLRIWYLDVTNVSTSLTNNVEFDISDGGGGPITLGAAADYALLYRAGQTGNWTELATGSAVIGDRILFNGVTLTNDGHYTIGTHNYITSTLPIELLSFNAIMNRKKVDITWSTASEKNNAYFSIERSRDAIVFEHFLNVNAAGNTTTVTNYEDTDHQPYEGISYYRLKQTDTNGKYSYSNVVAVNSDMKEEVISVFPNPSNGKINLTLKGMENKEAGIALHEISGKQLYYTTTRISDAQQVITIDMENKLSAGTYVIVVNVNNREYSQKIVIK